MTTNKTQALTSSAKSLELSNMGSMVNMDSISSNDSFGKKGTLPNASSVTPSTVS